MIFSSQPPWDFSYFWILKLNFKIEFSNFILGDDASPGHWIEQETDERHSTWNVTYSSKNKYEERTYEMTVRVYYDGKSELRGRGFESGWRQKVLF